MFHLCQRESDEKWSGFDSGSGFWIGRASLASQIAAVRHPLIGGQFMQKTCRKPCRPIQQTAWANQCSRWKYWKATRQFHDDDVLRCRAQNCFALRLSANYIPMVARKWLRVVCWYAQVAGEPNRANRADLAAFIYATQSGCVKAATEKDCSVRVAKGATCWRRRSRSRCCWLLLVACWLAPIRILLGLR